MTTDRIKEIQEKTAYPNSVSVQQALLQVWNECQKDMAKNQINFAEWLNDNGWIRRPFEEESGVYLYDDHTEEYLSNLYVNPKTINELYAIYQSLNKQD